MLRHGLSIEESPRHLSGRMPIPTMPEPVVPPKLPPHVKAVRRKGRAYYYLTRHRGTDREAASIRLPDDPRHPEFWAAYAEAMHIQPMPARTDTVSALITSWQASPEWRSLAKSTSRQWSIYCRTIEAAWGPLEVKGIAPKHVLTLRDGMSDRPASANNMLRCLSSMMSWSVPREWRRDNPCREVKLLRGGPAYAPWPWEVIEAARLELRPDLWWAVAVALYTGQRVTDCLRMTWSAIGPHGIALRQGKTGKELVVPIHRDLQAVLNTIPRRAMNILTNSDGRPWRTGFQATWNKHRPAGVVAGGYVFHGLRKSAVVMLLEAGCPAAEVSAVTGQSLRMVEHYGAKLNQNKLARSAMLRWENS